MNNFVRSIPDWSKTVTHRLHLKLRQTTWRVRYLPEFIIIGAQKSGTTSLFDYLSQHPNLIPSYNKEVHFFDGGLNPHVDNFNKGLAWYLTHFPLKLELTNNKKAFEASPLYLFNPLVPKRISESIPNVKLIAVLRNPTERAISHYFHEKRKGRESLTIEEALQAEEERLKLVINEQDYKNNMFMHKSYKMRGLYCDQIKRYLEFFPMSNILILNSESLFKHPKNTLRRVFRFLGVDTEFTINDFKAHNVGSNRTKIDPDVYQSLQEYFRSPNESLYELIQEDFRW